MNSTANASSAFDDIFNNHYSNNNTLIINPNNNKRYCPDCKHSFYNMKLWSYRLLIITLFLVLLESYSFICGGVGYIVCLNVTNKTRVHDKLFTDNSTVNNLFFINIILCSTSIIILGGLYCYNREIL
jgi:hypothetical protein